MQEDLFKCSYCSEPFDLELRLPKTLNSCSHHLCLACLKTMFTLYSPERRQCQICSASLPPATNPEDFQTDSALLQILQTRTKPSIRDCTESVFKQPSIKKQKNEPQKLFKKDKVRKKQKTEQHVDELIKMQELITDQFIEIRNKLSESHKMETAAAAENKSETLPHKFTLNSLVAEVLENGQDPLGKYTKKLKGIFLETQEALNRALKTSKFRTNQVLKQIVQEKEKLLKQVSQDKVSENEDVQIQVKIEVSSVVKGISDRKALQSNYKDEIIESDGKMEEEFHHEKEKEIQDEIQGMKAQIMQMEEESQMKLDCSGKDIPRTIFIHLCNEGFWNEIDQNKLLYLEVLEIDFSESSLTDQQLIRFIENTMTQMENLASITINFAKTKISSQSLQILNQQYLQKHKLKSIALDLSKTSIGDEGFEAIDDGLKHSQEKLERLELILGSTDVEGEDFMDSLFGMYRLKHLKLSFEGSRVSSEIVASVTRCMSALAKNIESLELNFNGTGIDNEGFEDFSSHAVSRMVKLKCLRLLLGETSISNHFLAGLFKNLGLQAACLETLELDFHSTELSDFAFRLFCEEALSRMLKLKSLKLDLSGTKITDISLRNLILPVNKLDVLTLNLSGNKIADTGFQILKENNNFQGVESLEIKVEQTDVSDEAILDFLNQVKERCDPSEVQPKNKRNLMREVDLKRRVLLELKKELARLYGFKFSFVRVFKFIQRLESKTYDKILERVLTRNLSISKITVMEIVEWRKIIQKLLRTCLINNAQKSKKIIRKKFILSKIRRKEDLRKLKPKQKKISPKREESNNITEEEQNNQHPRHLLNKNDNKVMPCDYVLSWKWFQKYEKEISFRSKVVEIMKSMKTHSFSIFSQRLFDFVRELSKTYKNWEMPIKLNDRICSYSWWYRYMSRDEEIANLWKNLPFLRGKQEEDRAWE